MHKINILEPANFIELITANNVTLASQKILQVDYLVLQHWISLVFVDRYSDFLWNARGIICRFFVLQARNQHMGYKAYTFCATVQNECPDTRRSKRSKMGKQTNNFEFFLFVISVNGKSLLRFQTYPAQCGLDLDAIR